MNFEYLTGKISIEQWDTVYTSTRNVDGDENIAIGTLRELSSFFCRNYPQTADSHQINWMNATPTSSAKCSHALQLIEEFSPICQVVEDISNFSTKNNGVLSVWEKFRVIDIDAEIGMIAKKSAKFQIVDGRVTYPLCDN